MCIGDISQEMTFISVDLLKKLVIWTCSEQIFCICVRLIHQCHKNLYLTHITPPTFFFAADDNFKFCSFFKITNKA